MPAKKQATKKQAATKATPRSNKKEPAYSVTLEHLVPTVQYGNVKYVITSTDIKHAAEKMMEAIVTYPPSDPLESAVSDDTAKGNKEVAEVVQKTAQANSEAHMKALAGEEETKPAF